MAYRALAALLKTEAESCVHLLSPPLQKALQEALPMQIEEGVIDLAKALSHIHPSWIVPYLRHFSAKEAALFLSILSQDQLRKIKSEDLQISEGLSPSPIASHFLAIFIFKKLTSHESSFLPRTLLPFSPLTPLLSFSEKKFAILFLYLGLHDLAHECKQIIDRNLLKKIMDALTQNEKNYLDKLKKSVEPVTFKRMNLDQWDGSADQLKKFVQHRGMNRLAKALYLQHSAFIWHITHQMECSVAHPLIELISDTGKAAKLLEKQVVEIIEGIQ